MKKKKPCGNCEQYGNDTCAVCLPRTKKRVTDKQRLDWLEKQIGTTPVERHPYNSIGERWSAWDGKNVHYRETARAAIDAAIRAEKKGRAK